MIMVIAMLTNILCTYDSNKIFRLVEFGGFSEGREVFFSD